MRGEIMRCFFPGLLSAALLAAQPDEDATHQLARGILQELIELDTTDSTGNTTTAARAMAKRLLDAGFPAADVQVLGPGERKGNLVARLRGSGKSGRRPILIIGHLDVVEARRADWSTHPFQLVERDGYFYGRGTQDMKSDDAALMTTLLRFRAEGFRPDRDLILALTADEEGGSANGVSWLLKNHRELVDAEFVINPDDGGVTTVKGKAVAVKLATCQKQYADFELTATGPSGHSSLPVPDNAIYHLSEALVRLAHAPFALEHNAVTRAYFQRRAPLEAGQVAAAMRAVGKTPPDPKAAAQLTTDPYYNAMMRTTCVATRLTAGHANNALPAIARAVVNCRILPGHSPEEVRQRLLAVVADPRVTVRYVDDAGRPAERAPTAKSFAAAMPGPELMRALEQATAPLWPGAPVIPLMEVGASDSVHAMGAGLPSFGIGGIAIDQDDARAHGSDERLPVRSFYNAVEFYYRFLKALAGS
jgi:acetylornithine deacetylase/succinyl-diaminopimelate desuccinylase-like protein